MGIIQQTLSTIKYRVKTIFLNELKNNESEDFNRGFRYCYNLFDIAFKKDKDLNIQIEQYNTKIYSKLNDKLKDKVSTHKEKINELNILLQEYKNSNKREIKEDTYLHIALSILKDIKGYESIDKDKFIEIVKQRIKFYIK